jgi:hypothetical protein
MWQEQIRKDVSKDIIASIHEIAKNASPMQ